MNVCATLDAEAAVLRDPNTTGGIGQFALIQSAAPAVGMEVSALNLGEATEIERAIVAFGGSVVKSCKVTACRRGGCSGHKKLGFAGVTVSPSDVTLPSRHVRQ